MDGRAVWRNTHLEAARRLEEARLAEEHRQEDARLYEEYDR
jgi:hypothetical protein